jgi:hypothetical protein
MRRNEAPATKPDGDFEMTALRTAAALIAALSLGTAVQAQDFTGMDITALNNGMWDELQGQMDSGLSSIIGQTMNNPQAQQMFAQYRANGYQGSFEQFAYEYAATAGFTPGGIAHYNGVTQDIQAKDQANYDAYRNSQGAYADAYGQYTAGHSNNQNEAGLGLSGQSTYTGAYGSQQLPHTWGANTAHTYNGNNYYVDQSGAYWMADPNGSGYWSQMGWQ